MKTNDAIVSELLEMNGGVGFDTEDFLNYLLDRYDAKVRADEKSHIVGILFGIDRQIAELVKEILNKEQNNEDK